MTAQPTHHTTPYPTITYLHNRSGVANNNGKSIQLLLRELSIPSKVPIPLKPLRYRSYQPLNGSRSRVGRQRADNVRQTLSREWRAGEEGQGRRKNGRSEKRKEEQPNEYQELATKTKRKECRDVRTTDPVPHGREGYNRNTATIKMKKRTAYRENQTTIKSTRNEKKKRKAIQPIFLFPAQHQRPAATVN